MDPQAVQSHNSPNESSSLAQSLGGVRTILIHLSQPGSRVIDRWQAACDAGLIEQSQVPQKPKHPDMALFNSPHHDETLLASIRHIRDWLIIFSSPEPHILYPAGKSGIPSDQDREAKLPLAISSIRVDRAVEFAQDRLDLLALNQRIQRSLISILGTLLQSAQNSSLGLTLYPDKAEHHPVNPEILRETVRVFADQGATHPTLKALIEDFEKHKLNSQPGLDRMVWLFVFNRMLDSWNSLIELEFVTMDQIRSIPPAPPQNHSFFGGNKKHNLVGTNAVSTLRADLQARLRMHVHLDSTLCKAH